MRRFGKFFVILRGLGAIQALRILADLIVSRAKFPGVRIIRSPRYIRTEGALDIGKGFSCGPRLIIDVLGSGAKVTIGNNVMAYHGLHIGAIERVEIGDGVLIASEVYISDHSHGSYKGEEQSDPRQPPVERPLVSSPVRIGNNVWIGEKVSILPGVVIGDGAIIGAGSIVTRDIPSYTIAVGSPAIAIKFYSSDKKKWVSMNEKG